MVKVHGNKITFHRLRGSLSVRSFTVDRPVGWQMKILLVFQKAMLGVFKCSYSIIRVTPTLSFFIKHFENTYFGSHAFYSDPYH